MFKIIDGWMQGVRHLPTSRFNHRPLGTSISLIVIHYISLPPNVFGGHFVDDLFLGRLDEDAHPYFKGLRDFECSTHLFISRTGQITQYVSFEERAWHAGRSEYRGHKGCNDYSIGIELEGCSYCAYTNEQYEALDECIKSLKENYPEISNNIAGHNEVAPDRKQDPGPFFNWKRYRKE